ncbi:SMI1/KNR4 family protein [Bacillus weihaiensis]|uniref:Knr4/Smi1-like domain-containing protein n=1 Tax=Bacillus weihaiensis TaxID=1547283 RepID=A0A1L3MVP2_9BACI|nr:SMI1/KNR4 family protein [Bacillus weihaiensis]APH06411.1 hypothetical protein A9C19_17665 [Bacillus weihaiensis]
MESDYKRNIISLIEKLHLSKSEDGKYKAKTVDIREIESKYNLLLDESYKTFLIHCSKGFFEEEVFLQFKDNKILINELYVLDGDDNLFDQLEKFLYRMPESLIPIGERPGGDQICLGVSRELLGFVYLWNHEEELEAIKMITNSEEDINNYFHNLELLNNSFMDFLNSLQINKNNEEENSIDLDDVEIWLDDDLL